jgi:DNA-binding NarL/FixJ family response regulator
MGRPRLLLADDHAMLVEGLRRLLQPEFDFVGAVGDGRALLEAVERLKPDVIVVDVSMPLLNGIEAVRRLKKFNSGPKVIFLSMHGDVEVATEALRAGASGYVLKHSASETLRHAIWESLEGRLYVSPRISRDVMAAFVESSQRKDSLGFQLTQREREVLQLVAEGRTIIGISTILKVAARTVVFHKSNIMDKLGLRTTANLTQYAIGHYGAKLDAGGLSDVGAQLERQLRLLARRAGKEMPALTIALRDLRIDPEGNRHVLSTADVPRFGEIEVEWTLRPTASGYRVSDISALGLSLRQFLRGWVTGLVAAQGGDATAVFNGEADASPQ